MKQVYIRGRGNLYGCEEEGDGSWVSSKLPLENRAVRLLCSVCSGAPFNYGRGGGGPKDRRRGVIDFYGQVI